jgi:hypothetical protein
LPALSALECSPWLHWQYSPAQWQQWTDVQIKRIKDRSLIKQGIPAFLIAVKPPSGGLASNGIAIGEKGAKPPM